MGLPVLTSGKRIPYTKSNMPTELCVSFGKVSDIFEDYQYIGIDKVGSERSGWKIMLIEGGNIVI